MTTAQHEITLLASNELAQSSISELRQLRVDCAADTLQISGKVRSFYHKQLAQEAVRRVVAGASVDNQVHVCP
ncbi:BON domain-containing protein [Planctomycetes bacterium K23_9]|uniref:BON domain protein n=1 Tax=Stieleria marina TaxID=1930275 RepID=A0A517NQG4_9BACT|nr:BON domain protein [Planctomycetes bacterium K23_9]